MPSVDDYLRTMIGDLAVKNASLQAEVDRLRQQMATLQAMPSSPSTSNVAAAAAKVLEAKVPS